MYKKIASNVLTVGQLKGVLTHFNNNDTISCTGLMEGFSVAVEDNKVLFDDDDTINEICEGDY